MPSVQDPHDPHLRFGLHLPALQRQMGPVGLAMTLDRAFLIALLPMGLGILLALVVLAIAALKCR